MEMHDGEAWKRGGMWVANAAAETGHALHRHAVVAGLGRRYGNEDRKRSLELIDPLDSDWMPALGLDRRSGHAALERHTRDGGRSR